VWKKVLNILIIDKEVESDCVSTREVAIPIVIQLKMNKLSTRSGYLF